MNLCFSDKKKKLIMEYHNLISLQVIKWKVSLKYKAVLNSNIMLDRLKLRCMIKDKDHKKPMITASKKILSFNWQNLSNQCLDKIFLETLFKLVGNEKMSELNNNSDLKI